MDDVVPLDWEHLRTRVAALPATVDIHFADQWLLHLRRTLEGSVLEGTADLSADPQRLHSPNI